MYFPTWIDLKGQDAVPETVHHVVRLFTIRFSRNKTCNCITPLWIIYVQVLLKGEVLVQKTFLFVIFGHNIGEHGSMTTKI